eukprot:TRINITY_DN22654_c0_g1_i1.p1 TRINITY_DN22654_c0_g1~~TRINITY_DN22654_c0_g1_i1.p1  ORF type:complete len:271 (+),score=19.65 TRINITY_DN22654_c0_g1_i1:90-815(+)
MSYTTMDKFGNVSHTYSPARGNSYIKNLWWPDFGSSSVDFSDQPRLHPTNTIFENVIVKPSKPREVMMAEPRRGPTGAILGRGQHSDAQFRRVPQTEALWSSTMLMPYKSGGRPTEKMEGAWHSKAKASHDKHEEVQATLIAKRTMNKQTLSACMSPMRSLSSPMLSRSANSLAGGSLDFVDEAPSWVASKTISSRPLDAAGLAGGARSRVYKDGASGLGLDPESQTATVLARTRSASRFP